MCASDMYLQVDRLCLICNRVEQNECECPCECPLPLNNQTCTQMNSSLIDNELCAKELEMPTVAPQYAVSSSSNKFHASIAAGLKPCLTFLCEIHTSYDSCVGLLGCEWCHLDVDGETKLQHPFCASLTTCFHGVLGSESPYKDFQMDTTASDELFVSTYSSVGPVAGSIVGLCFILALVFYCYRQYSLQFMERLYPCRTQTNHGGGGVQMSSIDADTFNDDVISHQDQLLANYPTAMDSTCPVSPYFVTTEYRKPVTGVDSDLGYSTMTPHEESERLSFALIELDSLEDDFNTSDAVSTNTSLLPYKAPKLLVDTSKRIGPDIEQLPATTQLLPKHRMLAPVTVHRNMETI